VEEQALAQLRAILARPEFRPPPPASPIEQLRDALVVWAYDLAVRAWAALAGAASGREGVLGWLGLIVLGAALLGGGLVLARAVRLAVVAEAGHDAAERDERRRRSDRLWRDAHRLAAAGRFGDAVRLLYLSALYALDERALLRVDAGLTNREHAGRLAMNHPRLADAFGGLVQRYDRLRYGDYAADAAAFAELSALVERTRTGAA
jgi:Domain of unknown function (DUF4129)